MPKEPESDEELLSPHEMGQWAAQEIRDATKALELRRKELDQLIADYSAGVITAQEADDRKARYEHRWGEPIRGTYVTDDLTDEEILERIDATRRPYYNRANLRGSDKPHRG